MQDLPPPQHVLFKAPFFPDVLSFLEKFGNLAVVVKIPPQKSQDEIYTQLACTDQDKAIIYEIIKTISDNGKLSLLFKQNHLKSLGAQINHVHPLKFLSTIFSHPELKAAMPSLFDDYFKRTGFMDGLAPSLTLEMEKGKLNQYLEEFAKDVGVSHEVIKPYFQSADWEALVRHLIGEPSQTSQP